MGELIEDIIEVGSNVVAGFIAGGPAGAVLGGVKGIADVVSGNEKEAAAKKEAGAIRTEADIEQQDAIRAAELRLEQGERFQAEQELGFLASGVLLKGSPLDVLEATRTDIETEFEQQLTRAGRVRSLRETQAGRTQKAGETSLLDAVGSGVEVVGKATKFFT